MSSRARPGPEDMTRACSPADSPWPSHPAGTTVGSGSATGSPARLLKIGAGGRSEVVLVAIRNVTFVFGPSLRAALNALLFGTLLLL